MDFSNIDYQLSNSHINNRFKSFQLDLLDKKYDSDEQTINFDDEYSEISSLYKKNKPIKNKKYELRKKNVNNQLNRALNNLYRSKKSKNSNNSPNKKIIDTSLKNLMEIDSNNKQDILNILMSNDLIQKKQIDENALIKEKNRNKYYYIQSKSKPNLYSKPQNTFGRNGFYLDIQEKNPEFIKDINSAKYKLKDRIEQENEIVAKLLFNGTGPLTNPHKSISRKDIDKKVKNALDKKQKNLQKIEWKIYEKEKLEQTFTPSLNHKKNDGSKRSFEIFLKDQKQFQKKIKIKTQNLLLKSQSEKELLYKAHPSINKNSEEIAKKLGVPKNVYVRLYHRNTYERKKNKDKDKENNIKILDEMAKTNKTSTDSKNKVHKKKYSNVQSKINIWKEIKDNNNNKDKNQKNNLSYKDEKNKKMLTRRIKSSVDLFKENKSFITKDLNSNKLVFNKFEENFKKFIEKIIKDNSNFRFNEELELDEKQYSEILYNFGMISNIQEKNKSKKEINKNKSEIIEINLSPNKEKKLIKYSFDILRLDKDKIKISNLKLFLIFLLNLHNYYFYHEFKKNHNAQEIQKIFPLDKYQKEEIPEFMVKKYNEELLSEIDKNNPRNTKYFFISKKNGKIIFTLENYIYIKNDFSLFNLNYLNQKSVNKSKKNIFEITNSNNSKEKINSLTNRKKSIKNKSSNPLANIDYNYRLLIYEKRKLAKKEKLKQDLHNKKIQECTFKPKINATFQLHKQKNNNYNKSSNFQDKKINRIDELYEEGKRTLKLRRNKTKEEIELEQNGDEYTFYPDIYTLHNRKMTNSNIAIDIYNERQYQNMYERLKQARLEKMVRNSNNDRYELNEELKRYVKDKKENNIINIDDYFNQDEQINYYDNENIDNDLNDEDYMLENGIIYTDFKKTDIDNHNNDKENSNGKSIGNNINNEKNFLIENKVENGQEKEEKIPLLIIDINIKEGLKKKLFVFEGDTPQILAQKFGKENNLDLETQKHLEELIQKKKKKLLSNIDEEN